MPGTRNGTVRSMLMDRKLRLGMVTGLLALLSGLSCALAAPPKGPGSLEGVELKPAGALGGGGGFGLDKILGDLLKNKQGQSGAAIVSAKVLEDRASRLVVKIQYKDLDADGLTLTARALQ